MFSNLPKTRGDAKLTGSKYYFTGIPCKHGHVDKRFTAGHCYSCSIANNEKWRDTERGRKILNCTNRRSNKKHALKKRERDKEYYRKNSARLIAYQISKQSKMKFAMPEWSDREFVISIYSLARRITKCTGIRWEVDHIVPIVNKIVCGLHSHTNLRIIPKAQNRLKSNKLYENLCDIGGSNYGGLLYNEAVTGTSQDATR